ncbi:Uma2 family endonuclease [Myxacorys almedinensis]|uniref:Uma2 family endonuclease n=1 Tax=Myxacorys almedinensis A TaxID=2690445 RepID=A0A8J7Z6G2_9CYAN|nr:Uma2 family endonuclease [Myxacorys almedinensis]NDJ17308.1 Uma2 family endonuclease [Myxacorys almedinensis A]
MVQTPVKPVTLEEFLKLPETKPASEYINGQIIQKSMPQGKHSKLQEELVGGINGAVKSNRIAYAFPELRCTFGGRSTVPDVAVFTWKRIPLDENGDIVNVFASAPDWTIEILSPEQSQTRVTSNIVHCLHHGTQLGWLIDPGEKLLLVYAPDQLVDVFEAETEVLTVPEFAKDLQLTLGDLFGWLKV